MTSPDHPLLACRQAAARAMALKVQSRALMDTATQLIVDSSGMRRRLMLINALRTESERRTLVSG